jgi:phosphoglycolate phosphatase-like HAD superfamily hydrolase
MRIETSFLFDLDGTLVDSVYQHVLAWKEALTARLNVPIEHTVVVGDSIWDMLAARRCRSLGVGLLSGGYGTEELERAGALRVYEDPADLLLHLDEVAARP